MEEKSTACLIFISKKNKNRSRLRTPPANSRKYGVKKTWILVMDEIMRR
jgi:hypothetical protein